MLKNYLCALTGAVGSIFIILFGGCDNLIQTLITFMVIDYLSGIVVAGIFKKSNKTESGGLQSVAGWKGLSKKCMTLVFVAIAYRLDLVIGVEYIRNATIIGFIVNELISIVENAGLMGLPVPQVIVNCIDVLKKKEGELNE